MKRLLIVASCLFVFVVAVAIAVSQVNFHKLRYREVNMQLPENIKNMVVSDTRGLDAIEIANYCNKLTCSLFSYSTSVCITPDLKDSKGHCVTYSTVCKELCNLAYEANDIDATAKVVVGQIKLSNINLHNVITAILPDKYDRFCKDHDVVEIIHQDNSLLIDPSLTDVLWFGVTYNTTSK